MIKKIPSLIFFEMLMLSLLIASLPSFEAPKNIFLIFFVIVGIIRQIKEKNLFSWGKWDWLFLFFILSNLLCTYFAGIPHESEWKGFGVSLTFLSVGWLLSRSNYSFIKLKNFYILIILSAIPPLFYGLWELFITHSEDTLKLHSVGHVNHSAIYLTMIFGALLQIVLSIINKKNKVTNKIKMAAIFLIMLLFISILSSLSRAALGVSIITFFSILLLSRAELKTKSIFTASMVLILILLFSFGAGTIQKQKTYIEENNAMGYRLQIWNSAIEVARIYPAFGIGMFNWKKINTEEIKRSIENRKEIFNEKNYAYQYGHAHSIYLASLVEKGLIGFFTLLGFMYMWLTELIKNYQNTKNSIFSIFWAGALSSWISIFIGGLVNSTFNHENGILACLFLGIFLCASKKTK